MIYYFSGTGNSLYVARHLADALGEQLSPMTFPSATEDETIALVFPVYGWGIPNVVEAFVRKHIASLLRGRQEGDCYLYAVMTCGDDMGYADKVLDKALLSACGRKLDAAFSVLMPDVYVCLPGFDVDSAEECKEKFAKETEAVKKMAACVTEKKSVRLLKRGPFPFTKTYVIRPLFNRFLVTDKYFRVDTTKCVSCGRCRKMCPVGNILLLASPNPSPIGKGLKSLPSGGDLEEAFPQWQSHCAGCLACYHACPHHAINFGSMTQKKGQYNLMKQLYG